MADAATTGTLVVVALSGGAGALFGAVLGQAVQLHRDKRQYEREDARHEREREQVLDDARTQRREERYVALLSELTRFDRVLVQCIDVTKFYAERRDKKEAAQESGTAEFADVSDVIQLGELAEKLYDHASTAQQTTAEAYFAAYAVASDGVREAGRILVNRPLALYIEDLTQPGRRLLIDQPMPRHGTHEEFAEQTAERLGTVRDLIGTLDKLLREELRLT